MALRWAFLWLPDQVPRLNGVDLGGDPSLGADVIVTIVLDLAC